MLFYKNIFLFGLPPIQKKQGGPHARVLSPTIAHGDIKNEVSQKSEEDKSRSNKERVQVATKYS